MYEFILEEAKLSNVEQAAAILSELLVPASATINTKDHIASSLADVGTRVRIIIRRLPEGCARKAWMDEVCAVVESAGRANPLLDVIVYDDDLDEDEPDVGDAVSADVARERLTQGNREYLLAQSSSGDISRERIHELFENGQRPFAVVIACGDSRVVPEHMFMTGLGELFVIRVAGNVVGEMEIASAVYACAHLHTKLLLVLGHTHCGAIEAAMAGEHHGAVGVITGQIEEAIGDEREPYVASVLNVREQIRRLNEVPELSRLVVEEGLSIEGAIYHTHHGEVDFLR